MSWGGDNEGPRKLHESILAVQAPKVNQDSIKFQIFLPYMAALLTCRSLGSLDLMGLTA
jgi:hypothetical protein